MNSIDASRWLPRLDGFGMILAVLAIVLQLTRSTRQVLLPLTATSRTHRHRLTARSAGAVAGTRLALPFNYHMMGIKRLDLARACCRAGASTVHMLCAAVLRRCPGALRTRSGRTCNSSLRAVAL